jgi:hypothetical protein
MERYPEKDAKRRKWRTAIDSADGRRNYVSKKTKVVVESADFRRRLSRFAFAKFPKGADTRSEPADGGLCGVGNRDSTTRMYARMRARGSRSERSLSNPSVIQQRYSSERKIRETKQERVGSTRERENISASRLVCVSFASRSRRDARLIGKIGQFNYWTVDSPLSRRSGDRPHIRTFAHS